MEQYALPTAFSRLILLETSKNSTTSFRRRLESSIFNRLDTGLAEGQFILSLSKGRCDEFLELPFWMKIKVIRFL